jgi:oligoendopeptidase F
MSALSHELGHALHHHFIEVNQPYEYSNIGIFMAEIASTTNEVLLKKYMYNNSNDNEEKIYILQELITLILGSVFTQTMFSEFEDYAHKTIEAKMPLTKDMLLAKYSELQEKYGSDIVTKLDLSKYACLSIPHFYRAYYVYSYATGITCAMNFVEQIENGKEGVINYRKFLQAGGSNYPLNILKDCGIDLESDSAYNAIFSELKWAIEEVQKIIEKR